jgi:dTDP-4-amino-4,6-dideoxygalactose transaminase
MSEIGVTSFATYDEWMKMERPKVSPHQVTRDFEQALCEYTGAKFAVTTTSCTQAILMALAWRLRGWTGLAVVMPKLSYVGVPAAILNTGCVPRFRDEDWQGEYEFTGRGAGLNIWDSARRFTSGMYRKGSMQCVSFHWSKILGLSQGGAILHDNPEADSWLRRARFDGRTEGVDPKEDQVQYPSWHAYLSPEVAAHGLMKLALLPKYNADLPRSDYPDLSTMEAFK